MKNLMNKGAALVAGAAIVTVLFATSASALIVSVSTNTSSVGSQAQILDPLPYTPFPVMDATAYNTAQQGFNEIQNFVLTADLDVDGGTILAGTRVNSHMIFLNQDPNLLRPALYHNNVEWVFNGVILGVMSDQDGALEGASSSFLGASGVTYPTAAVPGGAIFDARGFEPNHDGYGYIDPYTLRVSMYVTQPGDWIRVVTAVPLPAALPLYGAGVALLGLMGWRKRRNAAA